MPNQTLKSALIMIAICVAVYGAWKLAFPSATWRYKLTVEVQTPEGIKTGSAVREVHARKVWSPFFSSDLGIGMSKGEAVVIDLGKYGAVFALNLTYRHGIDGGYYIVTSAFPQPQYTDTPAYIRYYRDLEAGPKKLDAGDYPVFVRFRDPSDPKTVENLLEMQACPNTDGAFRPLCIKNDRFAEAFGEGVTLKSVSIEMTRERATTGVVEKFLSWLPEYRNKMFDGQRFNTANSEYPFANSFAAGAFKAGK